MRTLTLPKHVLPLLAGLAWCLAGTMVAVVGLPLEVSLAPSDLALIPLSLVVFVAFYRFVFSRLVDRHTHRIRSSDQDRLPFWQFFNGPSWAVMAVMMGGGMALRLSHTMPDEFIAFFYSGLGVALFLCGLLFLRVFARREVLAPVPVRAED